MGKWTPPPQQQQQRQSLPLADLKKLKVNNAMPSLPILLIHVSEFNGLTGKAEQNYALRIQLW
ncbi:hypothetical protein T03_16800 [Trichinella britovi]|uniref:Uncharacterized protein n=1 Tax=Trichinella britovi TaxID=45882 RepID=A0A0V1DFQ9_TRIBR|nr:hypothetical protein T03_16800 [Trichinella britovi]